MKQLIILMSVVTLASSCAMNQDRTEGKKILIYTRNGPGYVHDNIEASVRALEEICAGLGIETEVTDSPDVFTSDRLAGFDGIVFSNSNNEAFTSEDQRGAFQAYVRSRKGFAGIHSSCGSERDWPWF